MDYNRQMDIFSPSKFGNKPVHIIGCGATGSWVALQLAKLGVKNIHVYDFDIVEEHNIPNQAFGLDSIGKPKAEELALLCKSFADVNVTYHVKDPDSFSGVVFMLTDTMKSRSDIFKSCIKYKYRVDLFIETRMSLETGRIYCINPNNKKQVEEYEKTLYTDEAAETSICGSSKSATPTAMLIASRAVWKFLKWNNEKDNDYPIFNEIILNPTADDPEFREMCAKW